MKPIGLFIALLFVAMAVNAQDKLIVALGQLGR
jgi:hypothetical protein